MNKIDHAAAFARQLSDKQLVEQLLMVASHATTRDETAMLREACHRLGLPRTDETSDQAALLIIKARYGMDALEYSRVKGFTPKLWTMPKNMDGQTWAVEITDGDATKLNEWFQEDLEWPADQPFPYGSLLWWRFKTDPTRKAD